MKKLLLSLAVLSGAVATAQVGINTDAPEATLDIRAKEDQKGDLRIEGVEVQNKTNWVLAWADGDKIVKRVSLQDLKWEMEYQKEVAYIQKKQPARAADIIEKIKQCGVDNVVFGKHFGDGVHDFVYCAKQIEDEASNYSKTWLNFDLGAEYANINSEHFNLTMSLGKEAAYADKRTHGSLFQWQRAADGHEFKNSPTTDKAADTWVSAPAGQFVTGSTWVDIGESNVPTREKMESQALWLGQTANNPCPTGWRVPLYNDFPFIIVKYDSWDGEHEEIKINFEKLKEINLGFPKLRYSDGSIYSDSDEPYMRAYWLGEGEVNPPSNNFQNNIYAKTVDAEFRFENSTITNGHAVRCIKD